MQWGVSLAGIWGTLSGVGAGGREAGLRGAAVGAWEEWEAEV